MSRIFSSWYDEASDSDSESDSGDSLVSGPCSSLTSRFDTDELIDTCENCGQFYAKCCLHRGTCHHSHIVFTDGACMNNGTYGSVSGIGIAFGRPEGLPETGQSYQFSIPVDDGLDPGERRTNQRAELLAALHGLKKICEQDEEEFLEKMEEYGGDHLDSDASEIVITMDSQYVVKGMTEWLPRWKVCTINGVPATLVLTLLFQIIKENGFRKSNGERPSNLDLFLDLEAAIKTCQYQYGCNVEFWKIERRFNSIADELAKHAARIGSGQTTHDFSGLAIAF